MPSTPDPRIPRPAGVGPLVPAGPAPESKGGGADADAMGALRLVARREHEILALSELSQELTISLDLYAVADLILFNLMGQLGTSRAALWLISENEPRVPVLLRSHGIAKRAAAAIGEACAGWLLERLEREQRIVLAPEIEALGEAPGAHLAREEAIALFAPILTRGELVGILAVGPRVAFGSYGAMELQVLRTSLGMVGVALQNTMLYNRLLENNRRLRQANEDLRELDRMKSEFLSNVNHELRTPLTVVIGSLDCLLQTEPQGTRARDFLHVALEEARTLKGLLERLLDYSEARRNSLTMRLEPGDAAAVVREFFEERLPGVTQGLRELAFHASPGLPSARFDRQRLFQILDALVDNAVKFAPTGANIALRVTAGRNRDAPVVRIEVSDDGPGIAPEYLSALFDSFQQGDGSATRKVGGMGLGLALAKELAERMNGTLEVRSEIGVGSTFTLCLPAA